MIAAVRGRQRGLSLLEFTLFTIIMAVLVALALERIAAMRVYMERAAVEHVVARMREALALEFAELVVSGRLHELRDHAGGNPLRHAGVLQDAGVASGLPAAGQREPGQWYFDAAGGTVAYVPRYPGALEWPEGEPPLLRWRVRPDWTDADGDGRLDPRRDHVRGLELVRLDEARWR